MRIAFIKRLVDALYFRVARHNPRIFEGFLRHKGVKIGNNCLWGPMKTISIDFSRPSLVEIGDNVRINLGFTLMTHDWATMVFRKVYNDFVSSSGHVTIGNNVYFGRWCTVLKGVTIGDNCIIGYGSIVTKDIPANSVAVGRPAKVICTLEEYYQKRKKNHVDEALEYARSIKERFGRTPVPSDFWEEFPLFLKGTDEMPDIPIRKQLGEAYPFYREHNQPLFDGFDDFLEKAGL